MANPSFRDPTPEQNFAERASTKILRAEQQAKANLRKKAQGVVKNQTSFDRTNTPKSIAKAPKYAAADAANAQQQTSGLDQQNPAAIQQQDATNTGTGLHQQIADATVPSPPDSHTGPGVDQIKKDLYAERPINSPRYHNIERDAQNLANAPAPYRPRAEESSALETAATIAAVGAGGPAAGYGLNRARQFVNAGEFGNFAKEHTVNRAVRGGENVGGMAKAGFNSVRGEGLSAIELENEARAARTQAGTDARTEASYKARNAGSRAASVREFKRVDNKVNAYEKAVNRRGDAHTTKDRLDRMLKIAETNGDTATAANIRKQQADYGSNVVEQQKDKYRAFQSDIDGANKVLKDKNSTPAQRAHANNIKGHIQEFTDNIENAINSGNLDDAVSGQTQKIDADYFDRQRVDLPGEAAAKHNKAVSKVAEQFRNGAITPDMPTEDIHRLFKQGTPEANILEKMHSENIGSAKRGQAAVDTIKGFGEQERMIRDGVKNGRFTTSPGARGSGERVYRQTAEAVDNATEGLKNATGQSTGGAAASVAEEGLDAAASEGFISDAEELKATGKTPKGERSFLTKALNNKVTRGLGKAAAVLGPALGVARAVNADNVSDASANVAGEGFGGRVLDSFRNIGDDASFGAAEGLAGGLSEAFGDGEGNFFDRFGRGFTRGDKAYAERTGGSTFSDIGDGISDFFTGENRGLAQAQNAAAPPVQEGTAPLDQDSPLGATPEITTQSRNLTPEQIAATTERDQGLRDATRGRDLNDVAMQTPVRRGSGFITDGLDTNTVVDGVLRGKDGKPINKVNSFNMPKYLDGLRKANAIRQEQIDRQRTDGGGQFARAPNAGVERAKDAMRDLRERGPASDRPRDIRAFNRQMTLLEISSIRSARNADSENAGLQRAGLNASADAQQAAAAQRDKVTNKFVDADIAKGGNVAFDAAVMGDASPAMQDMITDFNKGTDSWGTGSFMAALMGTDAAEGTKLKDIARIGKIEGKQGTFGLFDTVTLHLRNGQTKRVRVDEEARRAMERTAQGAAGLGR